MNGGRIHSVMNGIRLILVCVSLLLSIMTARGGIYAGPQVFADGQLEYSAFDGGYFNADGSPCYYITDWQGNNAAVVNSAGSIIQSATYYPYGEPTVEPKGQRYLFAGQEREHAGGRNAYDFGARSLTPYGSWPSPDPKAEDFYQVSPFSYCAGDPINRIDENGEFWDTLWDIGNLVFDIYKAVESHIDGEHEKAKEYWGHAAFDFGTTLVPFVPAGGSKISKVVDGVVSTEKTSVKVANSTIISNAKSAKSSKKIGATGDYGEIELKKLGGESQVKYDTKFGIRRIDQLVGNHAHEAKVGYTTYRKFVKMQVKKDAELLNSKAIDDYTWHFYRSSVTGKVGPSKPLRKELEKNNIKYKIHE